ncbi:hypothetical protein ATANTOWER_007434 [Ataeniobius toweri]|uniref:Uncharacterized protein n=1 Tax=Ataeniobius toweri TaxID=208326 RepID=A0ABU7A1K2_9TELE|nr:hypothetical protein [Ataeniobius toweri]
MQEKARAIEHRAAPVLRAEFTVRQRHSVSAFCNSAREKGRVGSPNSESCLTPTDKPSGKVGWGQRVYADRLTAARKVFTLGFMSGLLRRSCAYLRNVRPVKDCAITPALLGVL